MSRFTWHTVTVAGLLLAASGPAGSQSTLVLNVELPSSENWTQITDRVAGQSYSREWVPAGENADNASWLIAQQKVPVDRNVDAEAFLRNIYDMVGEVCRSTTNEEIERHRMGSLRGAVGRTQCGQRIDGDYGTSTDRLVIIDGGYAYVITSELRTPPMVVDGIISFGSDSAARRRFTEREQLSRDLVTEGVRVE